MPKWNENIDGNHLRIASHEGSTMRVLAGPGTGKSYALKRKVMRLLEEGKDPRQILALTFTNVAADALKKDLSSLGVPGADQVKARTLHSLCFEILLRRQVLELTGRIPRPLMEFETDFLIEDLQAEFGGKKRTRKLLQAYESAFARQQQDVPGVVNNEEDQKFKTSLLNWLTFHRAMLIGELIPITYEYLRNNPTAPEYDKYKYILVDEYQDLNKAEQSLIDLLSLNAELLVIGDDDQSIYSFKYAHPAGITEFPSTHVPLEDVGLQICRRCPKIIVRLANELMGYLLGGTSPKRLQEFPQNEDGEIYAAQWNTIDNEAEGVAKLVKKMVSDANYGIKAEDILVLSPRRKLGYVLRDTLQNTYAIESHTFFQEEALDTQKAQKGYAMLNYLVDPDDRVALRVLLGTPTALPATYKKLWEKAIEMNSTPRNVLRAIENGDITLPRSDTILIRFREAEQILADLKEKSVNEIFLALFDPANPEDIEVLLSLINTLNLENETEIKITFTKLQDRIRSPEVTDEAGFLRIMSLHKSKGLTSKVVIILGCVAGLIPTIKDENELMETNQVAELERLRAEAKRLFYVALTRTTKYLILSSFRELDFGRAMQLNVKFTSRKGNRLAYTQTSPLFGEVARHLPRVITGPDLLKRFGIT